MIFTLKAKIIMIIAQALILLGLGWYAGYKTSPEPEVRTVEVEKLVEKEVIKEVKIEVEKNKTTEKVAKTTIKAPDGTVTETETTEKTVDNEKKKEDLKDNSKEKKEVVIAKNDAKVYDYRLGIHTHIDFSKPISAEYLDYSVSLSRRMFGPIWLDGAYQWKAKELDLGLSWEF